MTEQRRSPVILGAAGALVVFGVLLALFGGLIYGLVLVLCGVLLPVFFRPS